MCQLFTNASERESIAAAIKFVTEKGISSLNKMPNITDEDKAMKEAAILEIMSELVQWFDDVDANCAKLLTDKFLNFDEAILIKKENRKKSFSVSWSVEKEFHRVVNKSNELLMKIGYVINPQLFLKLV